MIGKVYAQKLKLSEALKYLKLAENIAVEAFDE